MLLALLLQELLWTVDTRAPSYGSGALGDLDGDGKLEIVFGTYYNDEHLYALRADGKILWKHKSNGGPLDASVAIVDLDGDGKVEVLTADSADGTLFCLDGAGKVRWTYALPSGTDSPPAVADLDGDGSPEIVVGTMMADEKRGRVVVLDGRTRKPKWTAKVPGHVQSEPALADLDGDKTLDVIVTTWFGDKSVRALNGKDGRELWARAMDDHLYHGVSVADGRIVAASTGGDVRCFDAKGKELWVKKPGGYFFAPTTVAGGMFLFGADRLTAYDFDGVEKWSTGAVGSISRGAAVVDGRVYFGADDRRFRALDAATGRELWSFDATVKGHVYEGIDNAPLVADFDGDGTLEAFFVAGKGTSDETKAENYGRAFALRVGKGKGAWPTFRGSLKRTGAP